MPICDLHVHTKASPDADMSIHNSIDAYCKEAINKNIKHLCFTDHFDLWDADGAQNSDPKQAKENAKEAQNLFGNDLDICFGMEIAHAHTFKDVAKDLILNYKPDFVLGSLHLLKDKTDVYDYDYDNHTDDELCVLYERYLEELYEISVSCDFDSLAHITYPLRYYQRNGRENAVPYKHVLPMYDKIFKCLIERQKALEINTCRFDKQNPICTFMLDLIKRYIQLGGTLFTIGSDSHTYKTLGFEIEYIQNFLKQNGIDFVCVYKNRKPVKVQI